MVETEVDEYKLDTNQGKKQHVLRVSLINDRVSLIILNMNNKKEKFYNYVRLEQFKNACEAFDNIKTIKEAINLIKTTIEEGSILLSEDDESKNIDIKFNVHIGKKKYPPFVIGLPIDDPSEEVQEVQVQEVQGGTIVEPTTHTTSKENKIEVLPTKFDYQGDKEAAAKYGETTKNTTEYANPIIKADIKEPNLILEYIEPILQVHYPDGTTKSTPLPPRLQTADGKKPNINPEQLKSLHEQMTKSFNQSVSEYEKENNRANSVSHKNKSSYSRQTVNSFGENNTLRTANFNNINYQTANPNNLNPNSQNNLNAVRSAINTKSNLVTINNRLSNIRSARTAFNQNDSERGTDTSTSNKNIMPRDNYTNYKQNPHQNKGISDYSISSVPNKPLVIPGYYGSIPNPTIRNNNSSSNHKTSSYVNGYEQAPFIQEIPRMISQNQNMNYNGINMYQRGLNKSSSTPSMATFDKVSNSFYHQNQSQTQYNFSQNPNFSFIQNQINNINLRYPSQNLNQSQNPYLSQNRYQNSQQAFNNISQDFNSLTRHNSSQTPLVSQSYIAQMKQQKLQEEQRIQAVKNMQIQQRIQEQKKLLMMQQKQKPNNPNTKNIQISQQIFRKNPNQNSQNGKKGIKQQPPIAQSQIVKNNLSQQINKYEQKNSQPIEKSRNQTKEVQLPLKQSYSQQVISQKPSLKNEITQQQIALAQMASLQNIQNPNNFNASTVQLNQRFLDSAGNEETQSQYEREEDAPNQTEQQEQNEEQEQNEINEAEVFENLYRTEDGLIIFRNGLLHGIIHKFAEITDVVSKIQIMMTAGVKFILLYRASEHGDRAKIFHEKCDKHQMTLVLVETIKGVRFGGFTTQTWDGNCVKKIDNNAFVFSLDKHKIYDIKKNEFAIGGYPKFGPVFFGCQIRVYDEFFKKGGTTCQRYLNYKTKIDYELNNGEQQYIVKEIEVYDVEVIKM